MDRSLAADELKATKDLNQELIIEEDLYQKKSRVQWLNNGDRKTPFFDSSISSRIANHFGSLWESCWRSSSKGALAVDYLKLKAIFTPSSSHPIPSLPLRKTLSADQARLLSRPMTREEIQQVIFHSPTNKAPGPDLPNSSKHIGTPLRKMLSMR